MPKQCEEYNFLLSCTIRQLHQLYQSRELSPVEVTAYLLRAAEASQPHINSFIRFTPERALAEARRAEAIFMSKAPATLLTGIPYNVKDLINVAHTPTTLACEAYYDNIASEDSAVVERLTAAGAVLMGKTNTSQLAMGPTNEVSSFGPVRNPRNPRHIAGGSSGGSGASVAAGVSTFSIGTDQGGSIRIPSACSGVVGIKPTHGRISYYGTASASHLCDHLGPLTRTVDDNAAVLSCAGGYDPRHKYSLNRPTEDFSRLIGTPLRGMSVLVPLDFCLTDTDPLIAKEFLSVLEILRTEGVRVKEAALPDLSDYWTAHQIIFMAGNQYNNRQVIDNHPDALDPETYKRLKAGHVSAEEYYRSVELKDKFEQLFSELMEGCDFMLTPTIPVFPCALGQDHIELNGRNHAIHPMYSRYTWFCNYLGIPALSVPCGMNSDSLPCAVQIIGRWGDEALLYQIGAALEDQLGVLPPPDPANYLI